MRLDQLQQHHILRSTIYAENGIEGSVKRLDSFNHRATEPWPRFQYYTKILPLSHPLNRDSVERWVEIDFGNFTKEHVFCFFRIQTYIPFTAVAAAYV